MHEILPSDLPLEQCTKAGKLEKGDATCVPGCTNATLPKNTHFMADLRNLVPRDIIPPQISASSHSFQLFNLTTKYVNQMMYIPINISIAMPLAMKINHDHEHKTQA